MTASEAPLCDEPQSEQPHWEEPLWAEPEFATLLERFVATFAPRLFALVEEAGERLDVRETFSFSHRGKLRLVWDKPECAIRYDDVD